MFWLAETRRGCEVEKKLGGRYADADRYMQILYPTSVNRSRIFTGSSSVVVVVVVCAVTDG